MPVLSDPVALVPTAAEVMAEVDTEEEATGLMRKGEVTFLPEATSTGADTVPRSTGPERWR
jgi:hypothetical protein